MRSVKANFDEMVRDFPAHSSLICFGRAVWGKKLSPRRIRANFNLLVEKSDFSNRGRLRLLRHFDNLTFTPVEGAIWHKNYSGGALRAKSKDCIKKNN